MKKVLIAVISVLLIASACVKKASDPADNSWADIQKKGEFVLGFDDAFPPMGFKDGSEHVGFDIDLAKEAVSRLGVKLVLQPILWDVKEQELNTKKIDCIWNGFTITEERANALAFTRPYMSNKQIIIVPAASAINTLADLNGKTIALQRDSSASEALNKHPEVKANANVLEFEDNLMAMTDLDAGSTDAVLMDIVVASYNFVEKYPGKYRILPESLADEFFGVGFRKGDIALKDKVEETLIQMAQDGKLAEISTKWFGSDITILK
ncbi:MAG: amino acid ABC transporter substrate-binding protein [Deferribacteraceae bacterium]|jgi:polar amino acid transport system substrate-binding protein|nr:amino acid ABC transporter substrate-binding protein [Deferribacteraceae bacterium]